MLYYSHFECGRDKLDAVLPGALVCDDHAEEKVDDNADIAIVFFLL